MFVSAKIVVIAIIDKSKWETDSFIAAQFERYIAHMKTSQDTTEIDSFNIRASVCISRIG
jgi:hypothetical protein